MWRSLEGILSGHCSFYTCIAEDRTTLRNIRPCNRIVCWVSFVFSPFDHSHSIWYKRNLIWGAHIHNFDNEWQLRLYFIVLYCILLGWDGLDLVSYCLVIYYQNIKSYNSGDRLCGLVARVLGIRFWGPGSIPGTTRKKSSGSGTGSTQPRECNWGATW
jgi:hypothetical protein